MPGTAIFDLDRTLTRKPTWTRFVFHVNRSRPLFWLGLPWYAGHALVYALGRSNRDALKTHALRLLAWCGKSGLESAAEAFVAADLSDGVRPGAREAILAHRARGDRLLLATVAADFLADRYARALGFDAVIATRTVWVEGPRGLRPVLAAANCYGAEKQRLVLQHDRDTPFARPVTIYSDHISDLALLKWADRGMAVNPSRHLRLAVTAAGIEIVDFEASPTPAQSHQQAELT